MSEKTNTDNKKSYKGIFKATSLFGGVQLYQILIEIIKSKFIALLLGPAGVGIQGLYTSGIQMIQQITSFGLSSSAVRNVAESYGGGDTEDISRIVTALRKLVWITGLLGMLIVIIFSPILSKSSFGDSLHTWGFVALSVTLLISQINAGQKVILQGTRQYKYLAKCASYGVTIGLIVSVPLYYFWGVKAIVPNLIISSITLWALSWYYSRKTTIQPVKLCIKETFQIGTGMLTMGLAMCISQFFATASAFALRSCIRMWGSVDEVGLYTAGFLLMSQYTGLVFSAMATDFYPRLAAVNCDNVKCKIIMNQQGEIGMLLLAPLLVFCIIFIPVVIIVLYSDKFLSIDTYIIWCSVGMVFKMLAWSISYVFIAKAESKLFMVNEIIVGLYSLGISLIGYKIDGLEGLGIAFLLSYIIYMFQVFYLANRKYGFLFSSSLIRITVIQFVFIIISTFCSYSLSGIWKYFIGFGVLLLSTFYTISELNKRIDFASYFKHKFYKLK